MNTSQKLFWSILFLIVLIGFCILDYVFQLNGLPKETPLTIAVIMNFKGWYISKRDWVDRGWVLLVLVSLFIMATVMLLSGVTTSWIYISIILVSLYVASYDVLIPQRT